MTTNTPLGKPLRPSGKLLQEDTRRHHRSLLLQQLFRHGPASRADLARSTALTRVTVSDLVGEMVDEGLVETLGAPVGSRVGKPPTLVGFAPDAAHIVCLDLSRDDTMLGAVVSLSGEVRERRELAVESRRGTDALDLALQLTDELLEAAHLDGAGELRTLVSIVAPAVVGPMSALALLVYMTNWDSYFWPLLVSSEENRTLPVGLAAMRSNSLADTGIPVILMAALLAVIPTVFLFIVLQRRFVEGINMTAGIR